MATELITPYRRLELEDHGLNDFVNLKGQLLAASTCGRRVVGDLNFLREEFLGTTLSYMGAKMFEGMGYKIADDRLQADFDFAFEGVTPEELHSALRRRSFLSWHLETAGSTGLKLVSFRSRDLSVSLADTSGDFFWRQIPFCSNLDGTRIPVVGGASEELRAMVDSRAREILGDPSVVYILDWEGVRDKSVGDSEFAEIVVGRILRQAARMKLPNGEALQLMFPREKGVEAIMWFAGVARRLKLTLQEQASLSKATSRFALREFSASGL